MRPSASEPAAGPARSAAFDRLHPGVRRWIWAKGWHRLHEPQEAAVAPVLAGDTDVLISAATASGKTEAAFLPICSAIAADPGTRPGVRALYVSPLKALINDQYARLEELSDLLGIPVHPWHGDVGRNRRQRVLDRPGGILLITPESLEALFVLRGTKIRPLLEPLQYVVVDELHSFIGTERGAQLQSLLHRVELSIRRRVPRIGLSATLGDLAGAADFLRPEHGAEVHRIVAAGDGQELRLQLRGYLHTRPGDEAGTDARGDADAAIAAHLFDHLRGTDNLVFANSRAKVEELTDRLTRRSEAARVPNEFAAHHGNLSKEIREHVESRLKDRSSPITAICTSTLEMGIDIGSVTSVAQVGAPPSVSALRQRLGRSGRRGDPAILRIHVREDEITPDTPPHEQLRSRLVQAIAVVDLLLDRWYEPPSAGGLHLSTLTQQVLSLIAQHGGVTPAEAYRALCGRGPFRRIDQKTFASLLRALGASGLLRQTQDGLLLHGEAGERLVNHYTFYAAFASPVEYRLVADGHTIGTLAPASPILPGGLMIFAGRRWKVRTVDTTAKVIELTPSSGGLAPHFTGAGADVHDRVRERMRLVYERTGVPDHLDAGARRLLAEARDSYRRLGLADDPVVGWGEDTLLFLLRGDAVVSALALALHQRGVRAEHCGPALRLPGTSPEETVDLLAGLAATPPPDPRTLAGLVPEKRLDKYDEYLGDELLTTAYAERKIDVAAAWSVLPPLVSAARTRRHARVPRVNRRPRRHRIGELPYAVIDTETTGLHPFNDRVAEVAVVRVDPDGTVRRGFTTVLQTDQGPGPTHVHGLTEADLAGAPRFAEIAGDLARAIEGAVVVAHNAMFDAAMLTSEFARAGAVPGDLLHLCTLELAGRHGVPSRSLRLADCVRAEGLEPAAAHTAEADAEATARLLLRYLDRAKRDGAVWLDEIGATGTLPEPGWAPWPPSGRRQRRTARPARLTAPPLPVPSQASAAATVYADLVARAVTTPGGISGQRDALEAMARRLGLDDAARQAVHVALTRDWAPYPAAAHELAALRSSQTGRRRD